MMNNTGTDKRIISFRITGIWNNSGRQKNYIIQNYRNDEQFRKRQKNYIIQNYRNDEQFRKRQKIISFRITGTILNMRESISKILLTDI